MKYVWNLYFNLYLVTTEWSLLAFVGHMEYLEFWGYFKVSTWCTAEKKNKTEITGKHAANWIYCIS